MSGFSARWLELREPRDHESRCAFPDELERIARRKAPLYIVDLGTGSGSNFRYLAPRLGSTQHWLCVDNDADLLGAMRASLANWPPGGRVESRGSALEIQAPEFIATLELECMDLAYGLARLRIPDGALVSCAALLDLVSERWLGSLVARCRESQSAVLFALSYTGRIVCRPEHIDDALIERLVNRHQLTDKGFGPALGPAASHAAAIHLAESGYTIQRAASDWHLTRLDAELQAELIAGWHAAAVDVAPGQRPRLDAWLADRRALLRGGGSEIVVSHEDLYATPPP